MLELHVSDPNVTGGTIAIAWCVGKDTLERLAKKGNKDPQVVIVVASAGDNYRSNKEYRKVVPLKDLMTYVELHSAGPTKIWGFITSRNKEGASDRFLTKYYYNFNLRILNYNGTDYNPDFKSKVKPCNLAEPILINVPKECFAPEPAEWEKIWVNYLLGNEKVLDQCAFRRRRLFAYTIQPCIIAIGIFSRFVCFLTALLIGSRNISLKPTIHPLDESWDDAVKVVGGGTYFIGRGKNQILNWMRLPFMPAILLSVLFFWKIGAGMPAILTLLIMLVTVGLITGGAAIYFYIIDSKEKKLQKDPAWYLDEEEANLVLCNGQNKPMTLSELPRKNRTFRLKFDYIKSKVCRPFSQ